MALNVRCHRKIFRPLYGLTRAYSDEDKSIYQKLEEGEKPRILYGKAYEHWRKPWIKREGEWYSKLSLFVRSAPNPDVLNSLQQIPNLTIQDVKNWWAGMKVIQQIQNQKYLTERVSTLGSNLAAVHFFTYRHAKVRLRDRNDWISGNILDLKLPNTYVDGYFVEAVDCSEFHHGGIRYEGLENLKGLNFLKWLSLKNNKHVDVWCLARVALQNGNTLQYLNIEGCKLSVGCIIALAKMKHLKVLVITDPGDDLELQTGISMLEQERPNLLIKAEQPIEITDDTK